MFRRRVQEAEVVSLEQVQGGNLPLGKEYRILYHTKETFKKTTKALGLMDDFKVRHSVCLYHRYITLLQLLISWFTI